MYLLQLLALYCTLEIISAVVDYCEVDTISSAMSTPGIQFTKELSSSEYSVLSSFKSLHCCAKGYRSIEWFKNGKAYPWPGDVSSFILYPESANQTIYSQALSTIDAGNYTCIVANDSRLVTHMITLAVFDMRKNYMDVPLPTYTLPAEQFVRVGHTVRLYCEAFVGKIDLPDANSEVWWERTGFNMSTPEGRHYHQQNVSREEDQVVGAYLFIDNVKHADFGEYICSISNTEEQVVRLSTLLREKKWEMGSPPHKIPWLKLQFLFFSVLLIAMIVIVYNQFSQTAFLYMKLKFQRRSLDDGKDFDVVVCYTTQDADFAMSILATTLQKRYNYSVTLCHLNNARVSAELHLAATMSRCLLLVMSPSLFDNQWTPTAICPLFKQLSDVHTNIICVPLQIVQIDATWKSEDGLTLRRLLAKCSLVVWQANTLAQQRRFWTSLRLVLPIPLPVQSTDPVTIENSATTTPKAKLSTFAKSNESLEVLV